MNINTLIYKYDPVARVLMIFDGEFHKGSLKGEYAEEEFNRLMMSGVDIIFTDMSTLKTHEHSRKVRQIRAIWIKLGIDQYREDILQENFGIKSTAMCTEQQLDQLISFYNQEQPVSPRVRAMRSQLLTIVNKMGIYVTNFDWSRVNAFFMDKRVAGKLLNQMTYEEMVDMVPKLHKMLDKHTRKQAEIERQQLMN